MKNLLIKIKNIVPIGAAVGMVRVGSNVYGSMNPMLALIFYIGQKEGKLAGAITGLVATLVSSIYCGYGTWVIMQAILWTLIGIFGGCFKDKLRSVQLICAYGFMFGFIMDIFCWYFTINMGYPSAIAQAIGGIPYDLRYCIVSTVILVLFYVIEYAVQAITYTYNKVSIKTANSRA